MLKKLDVLIKKKGLVTVTADLGYRSLNTIGNWKKKGKIPKVAEQKVKTYLANN